MRSAPILAFAALATACSGHSTGSTPTPAVPDRTARLDTAIPALMAKYHLPAAGVAIIEDGRVTWTKVYGEQSPGVPASSATLFNIASLTKPITAEAILRLVAAGKLLLDEPMSPFWVDPDLTDDSRHQLLTPRIALSHRTGFPNWRSGRLAFGFTPGTGYEYSGEGYQYLGRFAEKKLGRTFESLAQEYVLDPIGLASTSYSTRAWMTGRLALPDSSGRFGESHVPATGQWNGANNVSTTVGDYAAFMLSAMKGERLNRDLMTERFRIHAPIGGADDCKAGPDDLCPRSHGMSLGWERFDYEGGPVLMHTGNNPWGESSIAYFDRASRRGLVVLTNGVNLPRAYFEFFDLLDPGSPLTRWPRPPSPK